ncbi:hypothetical protein EDC01DRAFT_779262 [Geopyxis carbonaria]|nr:hypothetical protein EDC01DRAFT_779262 [Geopyxis carbonaria]
MSTPAAAAFAATLAALEESTGHSLPTLIQSAFHLACASVLLFTFVPALSQRYLGYGKTSPIPAASNSAAPTPAAPAAPIPVTSRLLDAAQALTVPHGWFSHYYAVGLVAHLVSGWMLIHGGYDVDRGADGGKGAGAGDSGGMRIQQVLVVWTCFAAQLVRRLYECTYIQKPGTSRMWILHYALGLFFYTGAAAVMVIEGAGAARSFPWTLQAVRALIDAPSLKTLLGGLAFIMASGAQHDAHAYLASLRKYSLPTGHPLFAGLVAPHYTAEVVIYGALAVMAAPQGQWVNRTVAAAAGFVGTNLAVAAGVQRKWYEARFGKRSMDGKWNILPGVY